MEKQTKKLRLIRDQPTEHLNICPCCAKQPQLFYDGKNHILRCAKCKNETSLPLSNFNDKARHLLYTLWNVEGIKAQYSNEAMRSLNVRNGNYLVFEANDYRYLDRFDNIDKAFKFMKECYENDNTCKTQVYHLWDNELHYLFHSECVAIEEKWDDFDCDDIPD